MVFNVGLPGGVYSSVVLDSWTVLTSKEARRGRISDLRFSGNELQKMAALLNDT